MFGLIKQFISPRRLLTRARCHRRLFAERLEDRALLTADFGFALGVGSTGTDQALDIATDAAGNSYVTGLFHGTADFDPSPGEENLTAAGVFDAFVAKYDSDGDFVWAGKIGGAGDVRGMGIAVDSDGNVHVTGQFGGTADLNPGVVVVDKTANGQFDQFVVKLDNDGGFIWGTQLGDAGYELPAQGAISVDNNGNVLTTGKTGFGSNQNQIFISKLDSDGNSVWTVKKGAGEDGGSDVTTDADGNVYVVGSFEGKAVEKLDPAGTPLWSAIGAYQPVDITLDNAGNVIAVGQFTGNPDFNPGTGTHNIMSNGSGDAFVLKLTNAGDFVWARSVGSSTVFDTAQSVAIDNANNISVTGGFAGTADFDPGGGNFVLTGVGSSDMFLWQLDANGDFVGALSLGAAGHDVGTEIAQDNVGSLLIVGIFQNVVDFDPGSGTANLTSAGSTDGFLIKLTQNQLPAPVDDNYEVNEDGSLVVNAAGGMLANDTDPDMDTLTVNQVLNGPTNGSLDLNPDGSFAYTPLADFNGIDSFIYEVSDGNGGLATATVTVTVLSAEEQIDNVFSDVEGLVTAGILNNGQGNSLTSKLDCANKKLDQGKTNAAMSQLEAFINQLEAFINAGILDDGEGDDLIDQIAKAMVSAG